MNILQQTPQTLVIGTPASALLFVRLIGLAISFPGLLVLAIYGLSGAADYSSLTCQRSRPGDRQCRAENSGGWAKQQQGTESPIRPVDGLKSGEQLLRYDYFQQPPADHIA